MIRWRRRCRSCGRMVWFGRWGGVWRDAHARRSDDWLEHWACYDAYERKRTGATLGRVDHETPAPLPFADLRDTGALWAINRNLFHPRGYALAIHLNPDGEATGWSLQGDGSEPWVYEPSVDEDRHFADFERLLREQAGQESER